jgi:hypothetical protein
MLKSRGLARSSASSSRAPSGREERQCAGSRPINRSLMRFLSGQVSSRQMPSERLA